MKSIQGDQSKEHSGGDAVSSLVSPEQGLTGRELDAVVAERVMGWQRQPQYNYWMTFPEGETFQLHALIATWKPSTEIATAMNVVERLRERGWTFEMYAHPEGFSAQAYSFLVNTTAIEHFTAKIICDSLPEAICRAALATVNVPAK